ncbi:MAG: hypothetical protein E7624_01630 [Ruminococcaceae bacterium]|nr:hypothetical protein [Oscillospiraceae bacterium]
MKRTLALLIAVLMVVGMLPMTVFAAAGQELSGTTGHTHEQTSPAPDATEPGQSQTPNEPTAEDYFAVYDEEGAWVGYYATLAAADKALADGYTLKVLQNYTTDAAYAFGTERAGATVAPISFTIDGALADGSNAVITANVAGAAWTFGAACWGAKITVKNVTMIASETAVSVATGSELYLNLTLENCKLYAGNSYYEVDAAAYATAPAANNGVALQANMAVVQILGEQTVLRATNGAAMSLVFSQTYVENGYFYSSAAAQTVNVQAGALYVNDAAVVNNKQYALSAAYANVYIHGGQYAVTAAAQDVVAAAVYAANQSKIYVYSATIAAGAGAYAAYAAEASIALYAATLSADSAALSVGGNVTVAEISAKTEGAAAASVAIVGEGNAEAPAHTISTTYQTTVALNAIGETAVCAKILNAAGEVVYYLPASNATLLATQLDVMFESIPDGGKLVLATDVKLASAFRLPMMPAMNITLEGETAVTLSGAVEGYLAEATTYANLTLSNVKLENTAGKGVYFGANEFADLVAMDSTLTLENGSSVTAAKGEALYVATGATVTVKAGATVQSVEVPVTNAEALDAVVLVEGGAAFVLDGGSVLAPKANAITLFMSVNATRSSVVGEVTYSNTFRNATFNLNAGSVTVPGALSSLHQISDSSNRPIFVVRPEVTFTAVDPEGGAESFLFNTIENPIELLDAEGAHVAYYDSIAAALADVKDGYTVSVLADHLETGFFRAEFTEMAWTLNGNGHKIYMPEINFYGMEFRGKNVTASLNDFTLYAGGYGIFLNPGDTNAGVAVVATNVFVYGSGAANTNGDTYVGNPANTAAYRVNNRGGELVLLGEGSGAFVNGNGVGFTYLIYNGGYLTINDGYYTGAGIDYLVQTYGSGARGNNPDYTLTYIAGGNFVGAESSRFGFRSYHGALTIFGGGNVVTKNGVTLRIGEGSSNAGYAMIFGGNFYHLSDSNFINWSGAAVDYTSVAYYGGTIYSTAAAETSKLQQTESAATWSTGYQSFAYGIYTAEGYTNAFSTYTTTEAEQKLGLTAGTTYTAESVVEDEKWLAARGYTKGDYTFKAYTGNGDNYFGVYGTQLWLATYAVGTYNGVIELQKNMEFLHSAASYSRINGPAARVTITSAPGECYTYASSNYGNNATGSYGSTYFLWLNGGTWIVKNISLVNRGSQCVQFNSRFNGQNLSRATLVIAEGGEIAGFTSSVLMADKGLCIVEEGGRITAAMNGVTGKYGSLNLLRMDGDSDAKIYGDLGFLRDGTLPTSGGYQCINYNGNGDMVQGTGEKCEVYIASTARLGGAKGATNTLVNTANITDYTKTHDVIITAEAGAQFVTDGSVANANAGVQLFFDGVIIKNVTERTDAEGVYFQGSGYIFTMNGGGGEFSNIQYRGGSFMLVDSKGMPKQDALTVTFSGDNHISTITNTLFMVMNASCNTDIVIEDGYYHNEVNGNLFYGQPDPIGTPDSEGLLTINGGYFFKDNGAGMFKMMGSYDVEVNGGTFDTTASSIFTFSYSSGTTHNPASGNLTINGGTFYLSAGYLASANVLTDCGKLTINDGYFYACVRENYAGNLVTPTAFLYMGGETVTEINGGVFETEEFETNKHCMVLRTLQSAKAIVNDWTVYYRAGEESPIRVEGDSVVEIYGGWVESNGRYVARTMGGKNTTTAVTTVSNATLKIYGGVMMLTDVHPAFNNSSGYCVVANGGSEQYGHVYIYGGLFINNRDGAPLNPGSVYSRYVMYRSNAFGAFEIYGGIMMATPTQDLFYKAAWKEASDTASIPSTNLPIVKGLTPKYEFGGREYYYSAYGVGDSLLVPELQPNVQASISEEGNGLTFISGMTAVHYDALLTWASAQSFNYNGIKDGYKLSYGTLIAPADTLIATMGVFNKDRFDALELPYIDVPATEEDATVNEDGTLDISATVENITVENNTTLYVALPYVVLTVGVGTAAESSVRYYGEYSLSTGVASMATTAAAALRDNTDIAIGEYQYPSVVVLNAFSRYTVEQQNVLVTYLAHEHNFNNQGVCTDADCAYDANVEIDPDFETQVYSENGLVKFYKMNLKKDVVYSISFSRNTVEYTVYDAQGNALTLKDGTFTASEDGVYYIRVDGQRAGATTMTVSHIHNAGYTGSCVVCEQELSVEISVEELYEQLVVKNNLYFYNIELEADIKYTIATVNGNFKIYNAEGVEQEVVESIFTCPEDGVYYIVVEATYTSTGSVHVAHIHDFDCTGLCKLDYCDVYVGVAISNVYKYSAGQSVVSGDKLFFNIRMEAGKTYTIAPVGFIGLFSLFNTEGEKMTIGSGDTFACEEAGIYYLVVDVQAKVTARLRFEVAHGQCEFDNKGECFFKHVRNELDENGNTVEETVSCGKTNRTRIYDNQSVTQTIVLGKKTYFTMIYAGAGVTYLIDMPTTVDYYLCDASGNVIEPVVNGANGVTYVKATNADGTRTQDTYVDVDTQRVIYLVVTTKADATESADITFTVSHVHDINHRGVCTVKDTTQNTVVGCTVNKRESMVLDTETVVNCTADSVHYYELFFTMGTEYTVNVDNENVAWALMNANGEKVHASGMTGAYTATDSGEYYLILTGTAGLTEETAVTVSVTSHVHTINNKGECADETCDLKLTEFQKNLDEMVGVTTGQLKAGTHYFKATMEAGKTYALSFSANGITYKLYGGENADVEMTVTDGAFACTESGTYYYVVVVAQNTAQSATTTFTVVDTPVVETPEQTEDVE